MGEYKMLIYRALSAVAAAAAGAAIMMAVPGFSPPVSAGTAPVAPVAPAIEQHIVTAAVAAPVANPCSEQAWPYYPASCLQGQSAGAVRTVRLVTTDRLPK
jgi:hypothetical protein